MKKKRLLLATGLGLVSLATTVGELWHKYKDRIIFYDEPNMGLYTGLRIPWPLVVDLDNPNLRWYDSRLKIENSELEERILFSFKEYGPSFELIEARDSEVRRFIKDFYPRGKIYLDCLAKEFPKLAKYLQEGNFTNPKNRIYIVENYKRDANSEERLDKGFKFEFPDNTIEDYKLPVLTKKEIEGKETLMDKIFPGAPFPNLNLGF